MTELTGLTDGTTGDETRVTRHALVDCDGRCPGFVPKWYCCAGCRTAQRDFYNAAPDAVKALWSDKTGFWDSQRGCRLDATQRPAECNQYNCSDQLFVMASARTPQGWRVVVEEMPRAADKAQFMAEADQVWAKLHAMACLPDAPGSESSFDQAYRHIDGPTVFLMQGMLGSGKSTWARKFCERHARAWIVSADSFRTMLHGRYEYHAEMDDVISASMAGTAWTLLQQGYDVVIDCGNLTPDRRAQWLEVAKRAKARAVGVVLPKMHKDWHLARRQADPHWQTDWSRVLDGELAAYTPFDAGAEGLAAVIHVPVSEVSGRRILILTASPVRDKHIDDRIAGKLQALGHEVRVAPCQRAGRDAVLDFKPDLVLVPPIRNPNSRDFVEELKRFGCAVVTRHTEPSCSWQDWKKMPPKSKQEILGAFPYTVDLELVWSPDEADILNRRGLPYKAIAIGAVGLDIYFDEKLKTTLTNKPAFWQQYKLHPGMPTLLISSPWGFADSSPDLGTDEILAAQKDAAGRDRHLAMVRAIHPLLKDSWNLLMTVHPGVGAEPYKAVAAELGIPLDCQRPMLDLLPNCEALIHAGSTAAISAHLLGIPAYQYGDVNAQGSQSWWGVGESPVSRVSPMAKTPEELALLIQSCVKGSNADLAVIKELEGGRYGAIDGHATDRMIPLILNLPGRFKLRWPRSEHDYRQLTVQRAEGDFLKKAVCGVCNESFTFWTEEYVQIVAKGLGIDPEKIRPRGSVCCPHCAARMFQV